MEERIWVAVLVGGIVVGYFWMEQHHILKGSPPNQHVELVSPTSGSLSGQ